MKAHSLYTLLILALLLAACGGGGSGPQVTLSSSGAFALYPMMQRYAEEYTRTHPDVHFNITGGGAGKGISDVLAGATDFGMVSRELRPEEIAQGATGFAV